MTLDTTGRENLEFWARVEAEEHEREREIEMQRELDRDGLDYLNPDANCGANDPAEPSHVDGWYLVVCETGFTYGQEKNIRDLKEARRIARNDLCIFPEGERRIVFVTVCREVVEVLDVCGHA